MSRSKKRNRVASTGATATQVAPKAAVTRGTTSAPELEAINRTIKDVTSESVADVPTVLSEGPTETVDATEVAALYLTDQADQPSLTKIEFACTGEQLQIFLQSNTDALSLLASQVSELREMVRDAAPRPANDSLQLSELQEVADTGQLDELLWQIRQRDQEVAQLRLERDSLEQQNQELAAKLAGESVRKSLRTASSSSHDALSWEERKRLIIQQMENDSFDGDEFIDELQANHLLRAEDDHAPLDAIAFVEQLSAELTQLREHLDRKDQEIGELRNLLEQQGGPREGGLAIGAAAIAHLIDADELVSVERERLQQLQAEWEEKFRQGEIEASLERAKLSRERQELAKKQAELEEQLEHLKRESRQAQELPASPGGGQQRRWLRKLGLSDSGNG